MYSGGKDVWRSWEGFREGGAVEGAEGTEPEEVPVLGFLAEMPELDMEIRRLLEELGGPDGGGEAEDMVRPVVWGKRRV